MKNIVVLIVTSVILLFFPKLNFAQGPDLGTAASFVLFTVLGAFDNNGATSIKGDIGTNAGAFTGFPPGTLVGQIHVADSISTQAAADVDAAYSYLSGNTCGTALGTTLGNNQVLTPNVYCLGAASTIIGDLILDGQDDPNALFIFQVNSSLSTSKFSNVILINSASVSNVYWQINGAFQTGDSSVFRGTVITNGAIGLLESSSIVGRAYSSGGAITLHNNQINNGISSNPLPIELLSFKACQKEMNVQLDWLIATETNNDYFTIQRTKDGVAFEEIQQVKGAGNSTTVLHYTATDYNPNEGTSYYRLKQTDFDGKFTYSYLEKLDFEKLVDFKIFPNPFSSSAIITINDASENREVALKIYSIFGNEVMNILVNKKTTILETSLLPSGIYFYKLVSSLAGGTIANSKIIQSGKLISQQ